MHSSPSKDATTLRAGAAAIDITPPLEVGLLMSSVERRWQPFDEVRKPLMARALVLEQRSGDATGQPNRVAVVSLDLLAIAGKAIGGFEQFKNKISAASNNAVPAEHIILTCTHTHTAPESAAMTDLHRTKPFANWVDGLARRIGQAIATATIGLRPCRIAYGSATAPGLGIHRRFKTTRGIMLSEPAPPADIVISREGPTDDSVQTLTLLEEDGKPIAIVVNATCHPVYEMCSPTVSPDFPGELCSLLEARFAGAVAIYLNGAAGNINPVGVSTGPDAAIRHGEKLARAAQIAVDKGTSIINPQMSLERSTCSLPSRLPEGVDVGNRLPADIAVLALGEAVIVFLPGEPFVETGLAVRNDSPFACTMICGFAEETVGYIPTAEAFAEGGYETSFGAWSVLSPSSEHILRQQAIALVHASDRRPSRT